MWYEKLRKLGWEDAIVMMGLIMLVAGVGMNLKSGLEKKTVAVEKKDAQVYKEVVIDVGGEVQNPGVYKLPPGSRVNDGLVAAGGLAANADRKWVEEKLNKADLLKDGQKIFIPSIKIQDTITKKQTEANLISLNSGTAEALDKLPGVGPAVAAKIIDYREKNGGFNNIEEIKLVSGIGDKMFENIKDLITL